MFRVTIELIPRGDTSRRSIVGCCDISNDQTLRRQPIANYFFRLSQPERFYRGPPAFSTEGRVVDFPRDKLGPWALLREVLNSIRHPETEEGP